MDEIARRTLPVMDATYAANVRERLIPMIEKNCQPFLESIGQDVDTYKLFRGMRTVVGTAIQRKQVRLDKRDPAQTEEPTHRKINNFFTKEFGAPFRNAVFATGNSIEASVYGNAVHVIYPIGDFTFLWSPVVKDQTYDLKWHYLGGFSNVPPTQKLVDQTLRDVEYTMNDMKKAILSKSEIMIRCKEYYAVDMRVFKT